MTRLLFRYQNGPSVRELFTQQRVEACSARAMVDFDELVATGMSFDTARHLVQTAVRAGVYDKQAAA